MSALVDIAQLARTHEQTEAQIVAIIEAAAVKPAYSNGTVQIFDSEEAGEAITLHIAHARRAAQEAEERRKRADPAYLYDAIERVGTLVAMEFKLLEERDEKFEAQIKKLGEQNILLLRAVEALRDELRAKFGAPTRLDQLPLPLAPLSAPSSAPIPAPAPLSPSPKAALLRVAIIGLINDQKRLMEREFSELLDLRCFATDDLKGKNLMNAIGSCDVAVVMTGFINHSIESNVRAAGPRLVRVAGGMSSLRDMLRDIVAKQEDYRRVTA